MPYITVRNPDGSLRAVHYRGIPNLSPRARAALRRIIEAATAQWSGMCAAASPRPWEGEDTERWCARCGRTVPDDLGENPTTAERFPNGVVREPRGMLTPTGAVYCADCAPEVMVCRVCGCSDEAACRGGCSWAEPGLCSRCVGEANGRYHD